MSRSSRATWTTDRGRLQDPKGGSRSPASRLSGQRPESQPRELEKRIVRRRTKLTRAKQRMDRRRTKLTRAPGGVQPTRGAGFRTRPSAVKSCGFPVPRLQVWLRDHSKAEAALPPAIRTRTHSLPCAPICVEKQARPTDDGSVMPRQEGGGARRVFCRSRGGDRRTARTTVCGCWSRAPQLAVMAAEPILGGPPPGPGAREIERRFRHH